MSKKSAILELHGGVAAHLFGEAKKEIYDQHGLFRFLVTPDISQEEKEEEEKKHQEQLVELMRMYQAYHNIAQIGQYVCRGSKLVCEYGTRAALLDIRRDHGVYMGMLPVMTQMDCRKWNILDFGSCMCQEKSYKDRLPLTASTHLNGEQAFKAPGNQYPHICVPLISAQDGWYQADTGLFVEEENGKSYQVLKEDAFLVCQYGGVITISEVEEKTEKLSAGNTGKKYVVICEALHIRSSPSSKNKDNMYTQKLEAGNRVTVVSDYRHEEKKEDGKVQLWAEIEYGDDSTAWVAADQILPDEPVVTEANAFPAKVTRYVNGKPDKEEKQPIENWYVPGGGDYEDNPLTTPIKIDDKSEKTEDRYNIAIGPKLMNPYYSDEGQIRGDDFKAYNGKVDVKIVKKNDENSTWTLKCFRQDIKAHTYNKYPDGHKTQGKDDVMVTVENGFLQTGIRYPHAAGKGKDWAEDHFDGSIIEFCSKSTCIDEVEEKEGIKLSEYRLSEVKVYFGEEKPWS